MSRVYVDGNSPVLNEMFARLAITGEYTSAHDFSIVVGNTSCVVFVTCHVMSRGDDLLYAVC